MTLFDYLVLEGAKVEKRSNGALLTWKGEIFAFSDISQGIWVGERYYYANTFNRKLDDNDIYHLKLLND